MAGQWWDRTFNPWIGCEPVSEACKHCYAKRATAFPQYRNCWNGRRVATGAAYWKQLEKWDRKAAREGRRLSVFVGSWCDVFEVLPRDTEAGEVVWSRRDALFEWIEKTPNLDYLLTTKRPENAERVTPYTWSIRWPKNAHLIVTAENQKRLDERWPIVAKIPAATITLSIEPMLGPMDSGLKLGRVPAANWTNGTSTPEQDYPWGSRWIRLHGMVRSDIGFIPGHENMVAKPGIYRAESNRYGALSVETPGGMLGVRPSEFEVLRGPDGIIVGGETGANARPMPPEWARSLRDECAQSGVAFFFKQWGEWSATLYVDGIKQRDVAVGDGTHHRMYRVGHKRAGRLLDGREHNDLAWRRKEL